MSDASNKQEFIDTILKLLTKDKGEKFENEEFLLQSIVTLSTEIQALVTAVDSLSKLVKFHNVAIEDLYTAQDVMLRILKVDEGLQDPPPPPQKNKKNFN
jgi:hypothetical protein